jgi:hypothetical protein
VLILRPTPESVHIVAGHDHAGRLRAEADVLQQHLTPDV